MLAMIFAAVAQFCPKLRPWHCTNEMILRSPHLGAFPSIQRDERALSFAQYVNMRPKVIPPHMLGKGLLLFGNRCFGWGHASRPMMTPSTVQ